LFHPPRHMEIKAIIDAPPNITVPPPAEGKVNCNESNKLIDGINEWIGCQSWLEQNNVPANLWSK